MGRGSGGCAGNSVPGAGRHCARARDERRPDHPPTTRAGTIPPKAVRATIQARPKVKAPVSELTAPATPSVYWDNPQAGAIGVATGPPSQLDQNFISGIQPTHNIPMAAGGQYLYWIDGGYIARANLDGSDISPRFIGPVGANGVAVDGQYIYWTTGAGDIGRANLDGSGVNTQFITIADGFLSGLAVDSSYIYWKDSDHRSIGRANLDGSGIDETFITGAGASRGAVAVDAQYVYWTSITGSSAPFVGTIGRANLNGTGPTPNFITGADDPLGLAVDSDSIYWSNNYSCNYQNDPPTSCGGGTIGHANLNGTGVEQNFVTAVQLEGAGCGTDPETRCGPSSVVVATLPDGTSAIYWDNPQVGSIGRETLSGSPANVNQSLVTGIRQLFHVGVAVDSQHLYWTNGAFIGRSNLDGTGANQQFINLAPSTASYVVADDRYLYWSNGIEIGRANLNGTDVITNFLSLPGENPGGLAVDSSHIYWADRTNSAIGRANLDGTGANPTFITGANDPTDVAVDGQYVYWTALTTSGRPPAGAIGRANLDGTGANPSFITGAAEPFGITVDYSHIYWANDYNCNYLTQPPSACAGGTIGRANLDGTAVDQSYITASQFAGLGCNTSPETRCGPSTVAVSAPTQPDCMRTATTPAPPPGGAVFAQPLNPASSDANVVVIPAGVSWTGPASCAGVAAGSDQVMTHPSTISVAPDAAVLLRDQPAGLVSAWGARDVGAGDPAPVLFPGRSDWQTTEADLITPQQLLETENGCPLCVLPNNQQLTPGASSADVGYQGDVDHAVLNGAVLSGNFDGWNFAGAQLGGATLNGGQVSGADFDGADLRGAQLGSLQFTTPPSFASVRIGALNGACTSFADTNLVGTGLTAVKADLLVPGCATTPLLPGGTAPLDLIAQLTVTDGATVDYSNANFLVTASNDAALAGANLTGIDLAGATLLGFPADLESTNFDGASLESTSLQPTDFALADLDQAMFEGANASGASFEYATLTGAHFSGAKTVLETTDFIHADVSNATFQDADITGASFDHALAVSTDFNSVIGTGASFVGAHIYGDGNAFDGARQLSGADFTGAVLAGSVDGTGGFDLTGADLDGAHFDNAQCIACNFTGSNLNGAFFSGAFLPGATLVTVTLQGAKFDGAWLYCGDPSDDSCKSGSPPQTTWPLALGSQESYGPVPFTTTQLDEGEWTDVSVCPNGMPPNANSGCTNRLFPSGSLTLPAPCSAVALDACLTTTSTVFDGTASTAGAPLAVVPATPPTWGSTVTTRGDYVALSDGTVLLVGTGGPSQVVAGTHDQLCPAPTQACGDGGPATKALLGKPNGLAVGLDGSLYIADPTLHRVRRIDPSGTITTVAGDGQACASTTAACGDGGPATSASLGGPYGVWASPSGALFIADGTRGIREVLPDGDITTLGAGSVTGTVVSVAGDSMGNLYAAADNPDYIYQLPITGGQATQVVGTGTSGYNGNIDPNTQLLLSGTEVQINHPAGLSVALNGDVVFADTDNDLIRAYVPSQGTVINDLAGLISGSNPGVPQPGFTPDGSYADATKLNSPADVTVTRGSLFLVADTGNSLLRQFGPSPSASGLGAKPPPPPPPPPPKHRHKRHHHHRPRHHRPRRLRTRGHGHRRR